MRPRIPSIDLNENPFCIDRRLNEEWHLIQLNRVSGPYVRHALNFDVMPAHLAGYHQDSGPVDLRTPLNRLVCKYKS